MEQGNRYRPTGFQSQAVDHAEDRIDLNRELILHPLSTFFFEVEGDSMINAFMPHKTRILVDRAIKPKNGDIILAVVNSEFMVRFLRINEFKCWLVPANRKYKELEITAEMHMQVWGVVTFIITNVNDLRCTL